MSGDGYWCDLCNVQRPVKTIGPLLSTAMKKSFIALSCAIAATSAFSNEVLACTGIMLKSADHKTVTARTIEWAGGDNHNRYVVVPRKHLWESLTPDGSKGQYFSNEYGYIGFAVEQDEFIVEGLNEAGLSAGLFYFPEYGEYEPFCPETKDSNVSDLQLVPYILGKCANVDEVIEEVGKIHIHNVDERASTAHWRFADPSGRQIVLEIIGRECVFYENTLGVLTNSPSLDWHLTNLNNYANLRSGVAETGHAGRLELKSIGGGSGFFGLPGDFTPPSRFVRAAFYQSTAPVLATSEQTVMQAFHILNNFDLPIGAQTPSGMDVPDIPSATQFTTATDMSERKIYIRSMYNSHIRCVDLKDIDFSKVKFTGRPLDQDHREPVEPLF